MTQAVATKENIRAIAALQHNQRPDWQGKWTAGAITVNDYAYFTLNGESIAHKAECIFTFTGTDPNGKAVNDNETITLNATKTILQKFVLRNGDEKTGQNGNKLQVKSNNHLTTD